MLRFAFLSFLTLLSACSPSELPDAYRLDRFRVLAILSDRPEVGPGESVTLTSFVSDFAGEGRPVLFSVEGCLDPGVGYGAEPTCQGSPTRAVVGDRIPMTGLLSPGYTGLAAPSIPCTVPEGDVIFRSASERDRFNGVGYLLTFAFTLPDGSIAKSFRTIVVSDKPVKNRNPTYAAPFLSASPSEKSTLIPAFTSDSVETYDEIRLDGEVESKTESLTTSWFVSEGDLSLRLTEGTAGTLYSLPLLPDPRGRVFVAVTRDGRGGVAASVETY
jgi:hypothetical protein